MSETRRVVVTGMGCVSGLGIGVEPTWRRALAGEGAIRPTVREAAGTLLDGPAAPVDAEALDAALTGLALRPLGMLDPLSRFALAAAAEAVAQAGLSDHPVFEARTAVLVGCGSGGNATVEAAYERLFAKGSARVHPQTIPASMLSAPASHLAMLLGVHGPTMAFSSACASSAHALGEAMHMIRSGRVEVALAGGAEACLNTGSWVGWKAIGAMADDTCRPFCATRKGMVLGEGAAMLVLESEEHAVARGAAILGELAGYGASSDATDMTAPDVDGISRAIRAALADAGVTPGTPALVSAHGTGTRLNDRAEAAGLRDVLGLALDGSTVIATKSAHGHLIGAVAALEFVLGLKALAEGLAPPVLNYREPEPECALPLALEAMTLPHEFLLSNSFAFGGLNAVLVGRRRA